MSEFRMLPTAALTEPANPARTTMDDALMDSLVASVRSLGVQVPLHVKPAGGGVFEVVAGHRRLKAARLAGVAELPCLVLSDVGLAEAVKIHENLEREDLSPVDEAVFYAELYEAHGEDVDQVVALVKRGRAHVEGRLNLLDGDKRVLEALKSGAISLGVAEELNKYVDVDDRLRHLDYAVRGGVSVSQARQWRVDANRRVLLARAPAEASAPNPEASAQDEARASLERRMFAGAAPYEINSSLDVRPCSVCAVPLPAWKMLKKHLCPDCATVLFPRFVAAVQGRES